MGWRPTVRFPSLLRWTRLRDIGVEFAGKFWAGSMVRGEIEGLEVWEWLESGDSGLGFGVQDSRLGLDWGLGRWGGDPPSASLVLFPCQGVSMNGAMDLLRYDLPGRIRSWLSRFRIPGGKGVAICYSFPQSSSVV